MKVVVSYINSIYNTDDTIALIDKCPDADGIHVDLMDGLYVPNCNFAIDNLPAALKTVTKPLDIHLMTLNPQKYFAVLFALSPACIYIHTKTTDDANETLGIITSNHIDAGIVINPNEDIEGFIPYFPYVKRVLMMSVMPGKGGQKFIEKTEGRLKTLQTYQAKYGFDIYIDGGITDKTIKYVAGSTGVVAGSFICLSKDFNSQIQKLKNQ